jgi:hypothetical protein
MRRTNPKISLVSSFIASTSKRPPCIVMGCLFGDVPNPLMDAPAAFDMQDAAAPKDLRSVDSLVQYVVAIGGTST